MNISSSVGESCAVSAIANLSWHNGPADALKSFCKQELGKIDKQFGRSRYWTLASFYVFSAGPEYNGSRYGTNLAKYIEDNELGVVVTPGKFKNSRHHPNSNCQAWIWHPDQKALEKWWNAEQRKEKT